MENTETNLFIKSPMSYMGHSWVSKTGNLCNLWSTMFSVKCSRCAEFSIIIAFGLLLSSQKTYFQIAQTNNQERDYYNLDYVPKQ